MAQTDKDTTAPQDISQKMRDYLAEIYRLRDRDDSTDEFVSTSSLAEMLDVSAPAVNRMVTKLKDMGLLLHEPYQGIQLTPAGQQEALKHLRRRRIVESFLVDVMGFAWHEIAGDAERLSSASDGIIIDRMYTMAGMPNRSPHGEPIPDPDGVLPALDDVPLVEAEVKTDLEITRVRTYEPDRLEYLAALGLTPGKLIQLLHIAPFSGPLQLKVGDEYRIIGHNLAQVIRVRNSGG